MEIHDKSLLKLKKDYLKLSLKIYTMRYRGEEPSKELLQQTFELGRLAGISEIELKSL